VTTVRSRLPMLGSRVGKTSLGMVRVLSVSGDQRVRGAELSKIKRLVRKRSGGWCECTQCRQSTPLPAAEFDHVVPLWEGGGDGIDNFQHLSRDCHLRKSATEHRRRLGID
jgi:5-methylcytosine-specific restriction protein A